MLYESPMPHLKTRNQIYIYSPMTPFPAKSLSKINAKVKIITASHAYALFPLAPWRCALSLCERSVMLKYYMSCRTRIDNVGLSFRWEVYLCPMKLRIDWAVARSASRLCCPSVLVLDVFDYNVSWNPIHKKRNSNKIHTCRCVYSTVGLESD